MIYEPLPTEDAVSQVAEGVHTALRKGVDSLESADAWQAIRRMPDWYDAASWFVWALNEQGLAICKKTEEKGPAVAAKRKMT